MTLASHTNHNMAQAVSEHVMFQTLVEFSREGLIVVDAQWQVKYLNPAYTRILGYTMETLPNGDTFSIVHPEDKALLQERTNQTLIGIRTGEPIEFRAFHQDGSLRYIEGWGKRLPSGDLAAFLHDITSRKMTEMALRESETKYRTLTELSEDGVAIFAPSGEFTYISPSFTRLFGYTEADLPHLITFELLHPDDVEKATQPMYALLEGRQQSIKTEYRMRHKNGTYRYTEGVGRLLPDGSIVAFVADITERVEAQQALEHSESRYRLLNAELEKRIEERTAELETILSEQRRLAAIIEATTDYVGIADLEGWSLYVNQHGRQMVGKTDDDYKETFNVIHCHPTDEHPKLSAMVEQTRQGNAHSAETILLHKQGYEIPVSMVSVPLKNTQGEVEAMAAIMRDISDQKRASAELQRARDVAEAALADQKRLIKIIEATSDIIALVAPDGQCLYMNRAGREALGISPDEDISNQNMLAYYPPEVVQEMMQVHIPTAIANGGVWKGENSIIDRHGTLIPISQAGLIIFNDQNEIEYLATIARDISDRKRFEKELQHAKEVAESASRAKSTFLANMSHEIRTPMNAIIGMTSLLLDTSLPPKQRDFVETIRTSSDSLLTIINDILDFSKIEAEKLELVYRPFNLRECVEAALDLLAPLAAEKNIDLAYIFDEHVPTAIVGDVTRLRQVLVNLLSNAVKFTGQGEVVVTVSAVRIHKKSYELQFAVRDTGIGVSADKMDRLFKAFSQVDASTTREFGGTGLGLAISKRLSEMMGGTIWAESEGIAGRGTTFHFTIVADESQEPIKTFLQVKQPQLTKKSMLIVDDNATNRRILSLQAQTWGMVAHAAALPSEALALLKDMQFDVAILDMHMPEMDGCELAAAIRKLPQAQTLPLFMLSSAAKESNCDDFVAVLNKPVKPSELYSNLIRLFATDADTTLPEPQHYLPQETAVLAEQLPLHILLAEDVVVNQKFAVHALERMGYRVDVVANGQEALDAVLRQTYDVVLMDVQMPLMDGLEATRRIRQQAMPQPQIVAMTANAMQGDREICLEAGMDDYISKPVYLQELRAALERVGTRLKRLITHEITPIAMPRIQFREDILLDADLITIFLDEIPTTMQELHAAVADTHAQQIAAVAHKIKGSASYLGATQVQNIAADMERLGKLGNAQAAAALLPHLDNELQAVITHLKQILVQSGETSA